MADLDLLVLGDANPALVLTGDAEPAFGQAERLVDEALVLSRPEDRATLTATGTIPALRGALLDRALLRRTRHVHVGSLVTVV